ncbi:TRAP transporter small permease [Mesorhizobium sp. L-8-3]|uniref:TRAP transporter small permease n=1 Tax=Mesorhizobium sp. L-8-3 TaxID=2744522 RepID=UPI0019273DB7|nr:TRAP transporter small permease [Mesorhizobium sp. L-8-3]BCH23370.1 hypothetical protein MesoLjLb_31550 [Mesorhizobium sp. L-8-3]
MLRALDSILDRVSRTYFRLSQLLLVVLVVGIFSEVVLRYFFGKAILGSGEIANLSLVWLVFLMAVVLHRRRRHIVITAAIDLMNDRLRRLAAMLVSIGTVALAVYIIVQFANAVPFLRLNTPVFHIPDMLFKSAPVFALVPIMLQSILDLFQPAQAAVAGEPEI